MDLFAISELWSRDLCVTWRNNNDHSIISMNIYWSERMWLLGRSDFMRIFVVYDVICDFFSRGRMQKQPCTFSSRKFCTLSWTENRICAHTCVMTNIFFLICSWYSRQLFSFVYDRSQIVIERATVKLWRPCSPKRFWGMNTSELGYTLFFNNLINNIFSWSCWPKANLSLTFYL